MSTRVRFEYRAINNQHIVYDMWYDKVRTTLASKYACKQYIKRHQEEVETEDEQEA